MRAINIHNSDWLDRVYVRYVFCVLCTFCNFFFFFLLGKVISIEVRVKSEIQK